MEPRHHSGNSIKLIYFVGALGTIVEWYDFCIYAYLSSTFSHLFFVTKSHWLSMMLVYTVFFISYLARPLGGILYGYVGDYFGRKPALLLSIGVMTLCMFITMILPTWHTIGVLAPVLLLVFRIIQSTSTGGELSGAFIYVLESSSRKHHGLYGSAIWAMTFSGVLFASGVSDLLAHLFAHDELLRWGWRLAYFIGGVMGLLIVILRTFIPESAAFTKAVTGRHSLAARKHSPLAEGLANGKYTITIILLLSAFPAAIAYFTFIYFPNYVHQYFHHPITAALDLNIVMLLLAVIFLILFGTLSDYIGRVKMVVFSTVLLLLFIYPILYLTSMSKFGYVIIAQFSLMLLIAIYEGPLPAMMVMLAPLRVRYTVFSFGFNVAFSIFAGSVLLISEALAYRSHNHLAPAFYFMFLAILPLIGVLMIWLRREKTSE